METTSYQKNCIDCKKSTYIPVDKSLCLPCGYRRSHADKIAAFTKKAIEESKFDFKGLPEITVKDF